MRLAAVLLFLSSLFAQTTLAQRTAPPVPRYEVKRATRSITIDGKLDDASWSAAGKIEFQFPWEQQTGAKQKTVARILWDNRFLYVGYECEDSDIVAHFTQRDDPTYRDDAVEIFINPDPAQKDFYYGLEMNANATLYDYFYVFPKLLLKRVNFSGMQLAVYSRGTVNQTGDKDQGWNLEVAIPWSNFEEITTKLPPEQGAVWTANLNRWDGTEPSRRLSQWSDSGLDRPNPHQPERFGQLVFID